MNEIKHKFYTFEDKTSDEVLLINGFQHINQLIPYINELQQENTKLKRVLKEIREYINNYDVFKEFSFPLMKRDVENQIKASIKYEFDKRIKKDLL